MFCFGIFGDDANERHQRAHEFPKTSLHPTMPFLLEMTDNQKPIHIHYSRQTMRMEAKSILLFSIAREVIFHYHDKSPKFPA